MTDLEKWKSFLDEMRIKYKEAEYKFFGTNIVKRLEIDKEYICDGYDTEFNIDFNLDGSFKIFQAWGE